ncbi:MAG: trypsin-like peptidase domain-containing protein [Alphaproteobacteria bacterium]|nr:trypsin-like peptidase domain-containing protein [Alphaproteobacteria bacterium]
MITALAVVSLVFPVASAQDEQKWQATLERVVPAVVAIQVTGVRDFDTEDARNSQGTGFVVDAENGWILTNRHMVHAGPVVAEATLDDSEEIPLQAIYRDPVHDFGFYRFDPADVRHMDLVDLELDPAGAVVGRQIRVVGNDAGEKVAILDGTLARVDRNAPSYGRTSYNDFNTFYLQAASNTSGGSSGSPVVAIDGKAIALNAGGSTRAASSFYLPLDRVVRAFELLKRGEPVTRGTLQATFEHATYAELTRLGLRDATQDAMRKAGKGNRGGLVMRSLVPKGPADGKLLAGDILVRIDGVLVQDFVSLESILDDNVGKTLTFGIERGGRALDVPITVQDLHSITPDTYLEVGRAVLTPVSYQSARNFDVPVEGVYVSVNGYSLATAGIPEGSILTHVDGQPIPDLATARRVLEGLADGQRVSFRFHTIADENHDYESVVVMDRRWFEMRQCTRDDSDGEWPCEDAADPPALTPPPTPSALLLPDVKKPASSILPGLVRVDFDVPYPTAGVKDVNYVGVGVVLDAERGLVMVDRDTVPVRLGDLMITFAGAVRIPGDVVFLHPQHDYAIVRYDPKAVGDVPVAAVTLADGVLEKGDTAWLVGLDRAQTPVNVKTEVASAEALELGVSSTPRFRDANLMAYNLEEVEGSLGGVITDKKGRVYATWASFMDQGTEDRQFRGLPIQYVRPVLEDLQAGREPVVHVLGAELERVTLDTARDRGVADARILDILSVDPSIRSVFEVSRLHGLAPAREHLRHTDIVLEIDGKPLTDMLQLADLQGTVTLTIVRDRQERQVTFDTLSVDGSGITEVVSWAGLIAHAPHYEVAAQKSIVPRGVYTAWLWFGSPAARDGILPTRRILAINDTDTPDLDAFVAAIRGLEHRQPVRVTLEDLSGVRTVETLKMDLHYWPTERLEYRDGAWVRELVGP